jgi:hypothetical protein
MPAEIFNFTKIDHRFLAPSKKIVDFTDALKDFCRGGRNGREELKRRGWNRTCLAWAKRLNCRFRTLTFSIQPLALSS